MSQRNWANSTKAALNSTPTRELKPVGGSSLEPISTYFQYGPLKDGAPPTAKQLAKDTEILGEYAGTMTTKKFGTVYHKVRTGNGLVAVPGSGRLNGLMSRVPVGAEVQIIYRGKDKIEKGQFAGKAAHSFLVNASETISE